VIGHVFNAAAGLQDIYDDCVRHLVKQVGGKPTKICFRNYEPSQRQKYIDMGVTVLPERPQV
jgi:hypothetical protein